MGERRKGRWQEVFRSDVARSDRVLSVRSCPISMVRGAARCTDVQDGIFSIGALAGLHAHGMVTERRRCANADYNHDYVWNASCLLLGILDLRICRLVVRGILLEATSNRVIPT